MRGDALADRAEHDAREAAPAAAADDQTSAPSAARSRISAGLPWATRVRTPAAASAPSTSVSSCAICSRVASSSMYMSTAGADQPYSGTSQAATASTAPPTSPA